MGTKLSKLTSNVNQQQQQQQQQQHHRWQFQQQQQQHYNNSTSTSSNNSSNSNNNSIDNSTIKINPSLIAMDQLLQAPLYNGLYTTCIIPQKVSLSQGWLSLSSSGSIHPINISWPQAIMLKNSLEQLKVYLVSDDDKSTIGKIFPVVVFVHANTRLVLSCVRSLPPSSQQQQQKSKLTSYLQIHHRKSYNNNNNNNKRWIPVDTQIVKFIDCEIMQFMNFLLNHLYENIP